MKKLWRKWGYGRKFQGDFLSRRSGMESGHDRVRRHTGAAQADGSARGGEQGGSEQPSWTPHLGDRQVHSLDGDGFRRLRHNAFQCQNVVCDSSQQNDALAVLGKLDLVAGFDDQSLEDSLGQRNLSLAVHSGAGHGDSRSGD